MANESVSSKVVSEDGEITLDLNGTGVHIHFDARGSARTPADLASGVKACLKIIGDRELAFAIAPLRDIQHSGTAYVETVQPMLECAGALALLVHAMPEELRSSDVAQAFFRDCDARLREFGYAIGRNTAAAALFLAAHDAFAQAMERSGRQAMN